MDDAPPPSASDSAPLDPVHGNPRELMRVLLPAARTAYIKAWELLADANTALERRRLARTRVAGMAADHAVVASVLRDREPTLTGDDLLNARHLATELERHAEALDRMAKITVRGLVDSTELRPEALGCGKGYREPARADADSGAGSRPSPTPQRSKARDPRERRGDSDRPFSDRGPKVPRGALGSSGHESPLADDLDEATRAKLEAMRQQLEP